MKSKWLIISMISLVFISLVIAADAAIPKSDNKSRGFLGVIVEPLSEKMKSKLGTEYGVLIAKVELDSPADEYGLTEDDVILKVNDVKIRRPNTLTRAIRKIKPGDNAKILILRDGKKKSLKVKIGELKNEKKFNFPFLPKKMEIKIKTRAWLGVRLENLNDDLASYFDVKKGALVLGVIEDSPAEEAGFRAGDVIVKVADEGINDADEVREIIRNLEPEDEVNIEVIRHGKTVKLRAILEETENEKNIFIAPGMHEPDFMWFGPEKLQRQNRENIEKMLRWHIPGKEIRIEKKITRRPGTAI